MLNKLNADSVVFISLEFFAPGSELPPQPSLPSPPLRKFFNKKEKLRREPGIDGGISTANRGGNVHKVQLHWEAGQT